MESRREPAGWPLAVGHGGAIAAQRIVAVAHARSMPIERLVRQAAQDGRLIDLSFGRRVSTVVIMDSGHVIQVALAAETVIARWGGPKT
jgi:regulator of extracellular matrix RemA (YlzA/DUF370 family)